ncbi:hypothetical protein Tco_0581934 [Tanacetum coccineum]
MSTLTFADTHNMVAFLEKCAKSYAFHEIIDFLNANQIRYALTVNPTIYTSCIEQFWATTKVKTVNNERQIQALVDKKKVIITETSIRSDIHLKDADANQEDGEDSEIPIDSQHILITTQPSTSKPQKKQSRRKQKKNTKVPHTSDSTANVPNEEHVLTHSNDPLLSGEDRMKLTELMDMCTKFFKRVLDLEHNKTAEAQEIINLKLRVKKLEKKAGLRTHKFKRLYKVGVTRKVASSDDEVETQRRNDENNDNMMFDIGVFDGDEKVVETKEPVINAAMPTKSIPEKDVVQESSKNVSTATIMVSTATIAVVATPVITTPP